MGGAAKKAGQPRQSQSCRELNEFILACIPDHELERAVIDYVEDRLAAGGVEAEQVGILSTLPNGVRAMYLSWAVESEVIDGGFVRYFRNWVGQFAQDAVAAFEFFAARDHARLLREAIRVHGEECGTTYVTNGRELIETHESWRLEVLEDHFYQLDESLSALRIAKIRSDPRAFCDDRV